MSVFFLDIIEFERIKWTISSFVARLYSIRYGQNNQNHFCLWGNGGRGRRGEGWKKHLLAIQLYFEMQLKYTFCFPTRFSILNANNKDVHGICMWSCLRKFCIRVHNKKQQPEFWLTKSLKVTIQSICSWIHKCGLFYVHYTNQRYSIARSRLLWIIPVFL